MTETREERIERLYAQAEEKLDVVKARRVQRGPVSLIAVCLGVSLLVGVVAAIDLRRLQSPRGSALAWVTAAVFGDCTAYLDRSVSDPTAPPDQRSDAELCRDLRASTEPARSDSRGFEVTAGEAQVRGEVAAVPVDVTRPEGTRSVVLTLHHRGDGGWVVVRTGPACLAVGCA